MNETKFGKTKDVMNMYVSKWIVSRETEIQLNVCQ